MISFNTVHQFTNKYCHMKINACIISCSHKSSDLLGEAQLLECQTLTLCFIYKMVEGVREVAHNLKALAALP